MFTGTLAWDLMVLIGGLSLGFACGKYGVVTVAVTLGKGIAWAWHQVDRKKLVACVLTALKDRYVKRKP